MCKKEKKGRQGTLENFTVFDPDNLPYQKQHLCEYLSELDEEAADNEKAEASKSAKNADESE